MFFKEIKFEQLNNILIDNKSIKILIPFYKNNDHYVINELCGIMVYDFTNSIDYLFNINHPDLQFRGDVNLLNEINPVNCYVYDYRYFYRYWKDNTVLDIEMNYWLETNKPFNIKNIFQSFNIYKHRPNIGHIIPITNWIDYSKNIINQFITECKFNDITEFEILWREIYDMEYTGISVNIIKSLAYKITGNDKVYTNYKPFTSTGRPSNTYNSLNYSAMSKTSGIRKIIKPSDDLGFLVEMDYEASHLRLLGNLIKYNFGHTNPHEYFCLKYFGELTDDNYNNSKLLSFKYLYGDEESDIEFFSQVRILRKKLYTYYINHGFLLSPLTKRKIKAVDEKLTESKLLNYFIQAYEAEFGLMAIRDINLYLSNKQSKLLLWIYDSFLLDVHHTEIKLIPEIRNIIDAQKMKTHVKIGKTFHDMIDITKKLN